MDNGDKIILDLCGGSGAWSDPYKKAGYDVRLVTLPDHDVNTYRPPRGVYGVLAAPPCTQFSLARHDCNCKTPRSFEAGMVEVSACLRIVWECEADQHLHFWALENPVGYLRRFLGRPAFTFEPFEFGNFWTKQTDLWGWFNPPRRIYKREDVALIIEKDRHKKLPDTKGRAAIRAVTPSGFAMAFFKANK